MTLEPAAFDEPVTGALVWRNSPVVPAVAFLATSGFAAAALYGHPSGSSMFLWVAAAIIAFSVAVFTLRMAFVVDRDGLAVRFLLGTSWVPWAEVGSIGTAQVRGSETIRILRTDGAVVDVPPSLLQPLRPMTNPVAHSRLMGCLGQVNLMRG